MFVDLSQTAFPNQDVRLRLFYDETNNFRRLHLENAVPNAATDRTFVLAGIALKPGQELTGWEDLRQSIGMQANATEIKFAHIAHGDYPQVLASRKLETVLRWLRDRDVLIHYSGLDTLHWSILDIVESMMLHFEEVTEAHFELKNELTHAARLDLPAFIDVLYRYNFPDLHRDRTQAFLGELLDYLARTVPQDRNWAAHLLKLALAATQESGAELDFVHDNKPLQLIDNFSLHFLNCGRVFRHGVHRFDRETFIEKRISELPATTRNFDFGFVDSKAEIGIQASDVIAGLFGRHFDYALAHSWSELMTAKTSFTAQQRTNLELLDGLVEASDAYSAGLFNWVGPLDTRFKHSALLHGSEVPEFLM